MSNQVNPQQERRATSPKKRRKKQKRRMFNGMRPIPFVLLSIILVGITSAAICGMAFALYIHKYINPNIDINLNDFRLNFTSFVTYIDKNGNEQTLEELHGSENRIWADIDEIPKSLQDAFVAIEDNTFYEHNGVNWRRSIGAAINYVIPIRDNFGGGSTITQQLIKNITGDDETSVKRKVSEIMRALELDKKYEKDDILELYLNTIYLGQGTNGVRAAAKVYFGKELDQLTLVECAAIAGITKNPYKYDPIRFPEFNRDRRNIVLDQMAQYGFITESEARAAKAEELQLRQDDEGDDEEQVWSYFTDEVFNCVVEDLMEEKGYSREMARQMIYTGGLRIVSTLDPEIQAKMDEVFLDTENLPGVLGDDGKMPQCAMVIIDQHTGEVKAMYGGRGAKTGNLVLNRATRTTRSPGSSIKPVSVYAPALEYGYITPASVLDDVPKDFSINARGWPKNSTNGSVWQGRMTVKKAIEVSTNTIAVDLVMTMTPEKSFEFATQNMGLPLEPGRTITDKKGNSRQVSDVALSPLALGGLTDGVSVMDITAAYTAFGNYGYYNKPRVYTKVYDAQGNVLLDNTPDTVEAMSQKTADYMLDFLTNVVTGPQGTGARAKIPGIETAGKTGTTDDDFDRWFVGMTPYYTAGVWFGYDRPQVVRGVSSNPALAIWKSVMERVHEGLENAEFDRKTQMKTVYVCADSGLRVSEYCQADPRGNRSIAVRLAPADVPAASCDIHVPVEIDGTTNMIANEYCPKESIRTVGLLSVDRSFPVAGVRVSDGGYVAPGSDTSGYPAASGEGAMNHVCTVHSPENDGNKPEEDPIDEEDPNDPGNSSDPDDPERPGQSNQPGQPNNPEQPGTQAPGSIVAPLDPNDPANRPSESQPGNNQPTQPDLPDENDDEPPSEP